MNFYGINKVTLIDYPGKIACSIFTHGCNLRCPFCHNPELVIEEPDENETISEEQLLRFLKKRINKLDGVVISGGEPLVQSEQIEPVLEKIKELGYLIKLDTNGTFPDALNRLIKNSLVDFVAIDLKCSPDNYPSVMKSSQNAFNQIKQSIEITQKYAGDYEIRTTVVPGIHDANEIRNICSYLGGVKKYVIQNFVPNGTIDPSYGSVNSFSSEKLKLFARIIRKEVDNVEIRENL